MKIITAICMVLALSACQQKKPDVVSRPAEYALNVREKASSEKMMCAQDLCVTEAELYQERGPLIYAIDDKLFYQKYEMAKTILLQKAIEKTLAKSGESFSSYHKKIKSGIKISDNEVIALLDRFKLNTITKESEQFAELKNKILNDRVQDQYLKTLSAASQKNEIFVKIPKKERKSVALPFEELVALKSEKNPQLKITIAFNPSARDLKNLFQIIESTSAYLSTSGEKISWYALPYSDEKPTSMAYGKLFLCSNSVDHGDSYKEVLDVTRTFENEGQIVEFLKSRNRKIDQLQKCFSNDDTNKKIASLREISKNSGLLNSIQVVYDSEIESQIPGLVEFKDRIETRLKTKILAISF